MHRHLVAVEIGVEGGADQRMKLDRLALDQHRLERLDAQPVQRRRAVQHHRVLADHLLEDVPHLRPLLLHHPLRRLDGGGVAVFLELGVDERLEQLERHLLRQPALVQLQLRPDHDHRAAGVIDALAQQVLTEPPLLALQHVRQRLQRPLVGTRDGAAAAAVVEQRVHALLQHPLLVAHDDVGRAQLDQALEAVVAVDHPAIQVIEVRGREAAAVERHQRTQLGRDHRHHVQDHPLRPGTAVGERLHQLQPLDQLLALGLAGGLLQLGAQPDLLGVEIDAVQDRLHRLGADADAERLLAELVLLGVELLLGQRLVQLEVGQSRLEHHVALEIEDLLELLQRQIDHQADPARQRLQEPDVRHRARQLDMPHALAAHLGQRHLHAALLADDAAELHPLVLAAQALVVLDRAEDARAEQAVALRLEGAVVDRLRLLDLAVRPGADLLRARHLDADLVEGRDLAGLTQDFHQFVHAALTLCGRRDRRRPRWRTETLCKAAVRRPAGPDRH